MPGYSDKAQPFLDAIVESVFTSPDVRDWLIAGTPVEVNYYGAGVLMMSNGTYGGREDRPSSHSGQITGAVATAVDRRCQPSGHSRIEAPLCPNC
jgi:hypothetical protein